jgi:hypothetical protein
VAEPVPDLLTRPDSVFSGLLCWAALWGLVTEMRQSKRQHIQGHVPDKHCHTPWFCSICA